MFDIGFGELLVIGIVALIVVGPKDLPGMFRALGRFTGKIRRMAREFQRAMEDAADEAGVKETASDLRKMTSPSKLGLDKLNEAADRFDKWEPGKDAKPAKKAGDAGPGASRLTEDRAAKAKAYSEKAAELATARREREAAAASEDPASAGDEAKAEK